MTFSIAALCKDSGQLGVAVTSSSIAVSSRCAFVRSGTGAALTQNVTDPRLGPRMLALLDDGLSAVEAVQGAAGSTIHAEHRQLALIDSRGDVASYTGEHCLGIHGAAAGKDCVSVGNLLASPDIPQAIASHFEQSSGHIADRLIGALQAGLAAGGEAGAIQSAGLLVYGEVSWPLIDLRVDWKDNPLDELKHLWTLYEPQMAAYRTRGLDPAEAPSYGVPGDL